MQNHSQIEAFFNALDFSWQDLLEFLPLGIIVFDENWIIKSVNRNATDFFEEEWLDIKLEGKALFTENNLTKELPQNDILLLSEGKTFESVISFPNKLKVETKLVIKGAPIFKNGIFKGGTITIENYLPEETDIEDLDFTSNTFVDFLKKINDCFLILNPKGEIKYSSFSTEHKCGFLKDKENLTITTLFEEKHKHFIRNTLKKILDEKNPQSLELEYYSEDNIFVFNNYFIPLKDKNEKVKAVIVFMREINDEINDGITYLSNVNKYKEYYKFANQNADAIFKINLQGNITYLADNAEIFFNKSINELKSKFISEIFPEVNKKYFDTIREDLLLNSNWEKNLQINFLKHEPIVNAKFVLSTENNNKEIFVFCNKIDLHQQRLTKADDEEKVFFKDTVVKSDEMILQANPNGTILFANEKFCSEFNYQLDEIRGINFTDLIKSDFRVQNKITDYFSTIHKGVFEIIPLVNKAGKIIEVCPNINISTIASEIKYFTIYMRKCSVEEKLFLDTAHALLYQSKEPLIIIYNKKIAKVNPKFLELFNSKYETDFYDKNYLDIVDNDTKDSFIDFVENNNIPSIFEKVKFIRSDSTSFLANVRKVYTSLNSTYSVLSIENFAEETNEEYDKRNYIRKLLANLNEYLWSAQVKEGEILINYISPEIPEALGYTHVEFLSQNNLWKEIIHPDDIEEVKKSVEEILRGDSILTKDLTFRIINKDGEIVWINNHVKAIKDDKGNVYELMGAIRDVTKGAKEKEEILNKISELERLNNTKDKFISIISHDLKSPFTSILGFSELIITDSTLEKDEIVEYVRNIRDASTHTIDLLNGLLDWTRLQTGRIEITPKIINASYIANKSVEMLSGIAFKKGLKLSAHVEDSIYINVDENLIFQVINNLVANSIKFTPSGGSIEIFAKKLEDEQTVEFTVKDTGVGIEEENIEKLFVLDKKFTTLGTGGERGTGLGLSLVKEIIEKHNGTIYVKSELNKGSEFIFTLPISSAAILILDTIQSERILYSKLVESITENVEILQSAAFTDALEMIKIKKPMVLIIEHRIGDATGIDFLDTLSKTEIEYKPSIIILAREISDKDREQYKRKGVDNIFVKPVDLKELKESLDKMTGKTLNKK